LGKGDDQQIGKTNELEKRKELLHGAKLIKNSGHASNFLSGDAAVRHEAI
jgi:hypothetical protein